MSFFIRQSVININNKESQEGTEVDTVYDPSEITEDENDKPLGAKSSSVINFYPEWCKCFSGKSIRYPHGEEVTIGQLLRYFFQCPPHGALARILVFLAIFGLVWVVLYMLLGPIAGFTGPIIAIAVLEISGLFLGIVVKQFGLPSLLAPLVIGILFRNIESLDIFEFFKFPYAGNCADSPCNVTKTCCAKLAAHQSSTWITPIREIALTMILTRAGLELSPKQLRKLKGVVPALAFMPCVMEALTAATLCYFIYQGTIITSPSEFILCLVPGFALAAVSPAVVVPGMLSMAKKGYGVLKGVPTLLVAASSIDDVLAISLFTLFLSLGLAGGHGKGKLVERCHNLLPVHGEGVGTTWEIAGGFLGLGVGIVHGIIFGMLLHFLPSRDNSSKATTRLILLLSLNIASMLGYNHTGFLSSAGSVGVLLTSFIASFGWRSMSGWKPIMHEIEHKLAHLWTLAVPILFGTIGKEMKFVQDPNDDYFPPSLKNQTEYRTLGHPFSGINIAKLFGIIACCLLIRSITAYLVAGFAGLNVKERIFVCLAWIPKATVQAALAPLVITTVLDNGHDELKYRWFALNTVALAVFGILLTAPLGALAITFAGPRLLTKVSPEDVEEEFPNGEAALPEEEEPPPLPSRRSSEHRRLSSLTSERKRSTVIPEVANEINEGADVGSNGSDTNVTEGQSGPSTPKVSFSKPIGTGSPRGSDT